MPFPPKSGAETDRIAALQSYHILDTAEEKDFDDLTALASAICQVPIALISLVDEDRQWFKSHHGLPASQTPLEQSFCAHAILSSNDIMVVEDANLDLRFKDNPLVTGQPNITFYAGVPLVNEDGHKLGTLCVIDPKKKLLTERQQASLKIIARQVMDKLELRRKIMLLEASNHALKLSEERIAALNTTLRFSDARTQSMVEQAPVAIIVFRGEELMIEAVNPPMLALLGKPATIHNRPLLDAIPELEGQPAYELLYKVYTTGETIYGNDTLVVLNRNGKQETGYFNFTYSPLIEDGKITGIIDMAYEVTEQVIARKRFEENYLEMQSLNTELLETQLALQIKNEQLKDSETGLLLAIDSANLAMWQYDIARQSIAVSDKYRTMFGLPDHGSISLAGITEIIFQEDRVTVENIIEKALTNNGNVFAEFRIEHLITGETRWIRAVGKIIYDKQGQPVNIIGMNLDVTEQKQDDQRKNDFIAMVSHELKTPLTSLSAYLQMLEARAKKQEEAFVAGALDKARKQVGKMNTMINGF